MPELRSFKLQTDSRRRHATAISQLQLCDDVKAELSLVGSETVGLGLLGKEWSLRCSLPNQEALLKMKRGCVMLSQHIPAGKLYLAPSPAVKVDKRLQLPNRSDSCRITLLHDMLLRHSSAAASLYHAKDRCTKLAAAVHSHKGTELVLRHKLYRPAVHSVATLFSPQRGPSLRVKSRHGKDKKVSITVSPQQRAMSGVLTYKPGTGQTVVKMEADVYLDQPAKTKWLLDIEWKM